MVPKCSLCAKAENATNSPQKIKDLGVSTATHAACVRAEGRTGQEATGLNQGGEIHVRPEGKPAKDSEGVEQQPGRAEMLQHGESSSGAVRGATSRSRASLVHRVRRDALGPAAPACLPAGYRVP